MLDRLVSPENSLLDGVRTLEACFLALPTQEEMDALIADSQAAETRGYFDPLEDERLREAYARYLAIRVAIWEIVQTLKPHYRDFRQTKQILSKQDTQAFAIAFAGAEIIVKTGEYLINLARDRDIVWQKLDEAEPRYGLERKNFTRLYRQLTSTLRMRGFYQACEYFDAHRENIMCSLDNEGFKIVFKILTRLNLPSASRGDHLRRYSRFVNFSVRRRGVSSFNKTMFAIFEATGSDIAELKIPLIKAPDSPKRVTTEVIEKLKAKLRPGDVFITRHDDAMSNLFLPGFWPHGALYIGDGTMRKAWGISFAQDGFRTVSDETVNILEAKKDGVLLREIEDTLQVDALVVLRPNLSQSHIVKALNRGLSHAGKLYDFVFDFGTANRLVCTEVIYRAYHGVGPVNFTLSLKAGRHCLSAEDLLNQAIKNDWFSPVIICNVGKTDWAEGDIAKDILRQSFASEF